MAKTQAGRIGAISGEKEEEEDESRHTGDANGTQTKLDIWDRGKVTEPHDRMQILERC